MAFRTATALKELRHDLHDRFGIEFRDNWTVHYLRRVFAPVLSFVVFLAWLASGVEEIPLTNRGIYERFGTPIQVRGPGLHFGVPWPFGRTRRTENGTVHELAASASADARAEMQAASAEGPAPASANRLWDASHLAENSQLISSVADGRQSLQIVNMDVRFIYRIGMTDEAAMSAVYGTTDVQTLIRSTASRVLVHYFASRTLEGSLGPARATIARDIGHIVQRDLDRLASGVEILETVIESIHPPGGAANAYHSVQAAQITSQAMFARERGFASEQRNDALVKATALRDGAHGTAHETLAAARAADVRFSADADAYESAGRVLLRERYLTQLANGLAKAQILLIDHRIGASGAGMPIIDLRPYSTPSDPRGQER